MLHACLWESPFGTMVLTEEDGALTSLYLGEKLPAGAAGPTPLLQAAMAQLEEYFRGERTQFSLPLAPKGTLFQREVWQELTRIPYGETITYRQLAERLGRPKASRAVGHANGKNPIWIIQPCHRVVGSDGSLTGYAGGLAMKQALLDWERTHKPQL